MEQSTDTKALGTRVHRSNRERGEIPKDEESTLFKVFECIRALDNAGIEPTRELIASQTGLKLTTIDDRIKVLREEHLISLRALCYKPITQHPPTRAISMTPLHNGTAKLEVGDFLLTLTPEELHKLGLLTQGFCMEAVALSRVSAVSEVIVKLGFEVQQLRASLRAATKGQANTPQLPLI